LVPLSLRDERRALHGALLALSFLAFAVASDLRMRALAREVVFTAVVAPINRALFQILHLCVSAASALRETLLALAFAFTLGCLHLRVEDERQDVPLVVFPELCEILDVLALLIIEFLESFDGLEVILWLVDAIFLYKACTPPLMCLLLRAMCSTISLLALAYVGNRMDSRRI